MKTKILTQVLLAAMMIVGGIAFPQRASAQLSKIPQRNSIVTIEHETGLEETFEVFDAPKDGIHHYWLTVGHLGFGDEVFQVYFDPAFELFIPLGDNLTDALKTMEELQALFKSPKGTSIETEGCLSVGIPKEAKLETVKVAYHKPLITKILEFSVQREGYIRSAQVGKDDFGSLVRGVKFYYKLHPKER